MKIAVIIASLILVITLLTKSDSFASTSLVEPVEKIPHATDSISIQFSANFQSRHIWRGALTCDAWNLQPTINFSNKKLLFGAWGAYTVDNSYAEIDLYISYTFNNFTIALLDYFCPDETQTFNHLFNFKQKTTQHTLDAIISYEGPKKFPINFMISTLVWGDDIDPLSGKNFYSTYAEVGFTWERSSFQKFDINVGVTPFEGYYANSFNVVNLGFGINQTVPVSEFLKIPVFGELIVNPYTENIFFVFGLTLNIN